jgi:thioredoxin reductase (NADPH)
MVEDVVIIGSGPAGLSAALYTSREGFNPVLISGQDAGGQLELTTSVENYPGFPDGIMGPDLIELMKKQAEKFGTRFVSDQVIDVDFSSRPFTITTGGSSYQAKTVIIATGASSKMLGIESENRYIGKGLSTCATCDGALFKNKDVIVIGGGDTAMEDSFFLTRFARSITLIHRRNEFRASKIMQQKVLSNEKIKVIWDTTIEEILGNGKVTGVKTKNIKTNAVGEVRADGVFLAIGHVPNTSFLEGKLELDEKGYIVTRDEVLTDIEGVFVAGDVADHVYQQAVTAAASGTKAALKVRAYLQNNP